MNSITEQQYKSLKRQLSNALSANRKGMAAIEANDLGACLKANKKVDWRCDQSLVDYIFHISKALCQTKIDGKGNKSTAMFQAFDNLWTIGFLGSVFIDVKVLGEAFRVHYTSFGDGRHNFFVEKH